MNDDASGNIPAWNKVSLRAVLVDGNGHPGAALQEAGIFGPVAVPVVFRDDDDLPSFILGDGMTPNLAGILVADADEDLGAAPVGGAPARPDRTGADAAAVATATPAFGYRSFAPINPNGGRSVGPPPPLSRRLAAGGSVGDDGTEPDGRGSADRSSWTDDLRSVATGLSDAAERFVAGHPAEVGAALVGAGAVLAVTGLGIPGGTALAAAGGGVIASAAAVDAAAVGAGAAAIAAGTIMMAKNPAERGDATVPKLTGKGRERLGDLAGTGIERKTVADAIRSRGGSGSNVNRLSTDMRQMSVAEVANKAAQGDSDAIRALKLIKDAKRLGQRY